LTATRSLFIAAWHSFCVANPLLVSRRRSSVSFRALPHFGQLALGRRSIHSLLLQAVHRCAAAMPMSTMYSQLPGRRAFLRDLAWSSPSRVSTLQQQLRSGGGGQQRGTTHRKHGPAADRQPVRCARCRRRVGGEAVCSRFSPATGQRDLHCQCRLWPYVAQFRARSGPICGRREARSPFPRPSEGRKP
jgi:hypothetical protein